MIDLHLHTTASDGACSPSTLVRRAWMAGLRTISVTDHDTTAGLAAAADAASGYGLEFVNGIEITSVVAGLDVHLLGYFFDPADPPLAGFLREQRSTRVTRAKEIGRRLIALGKGIDLEPLLRRAEVDPGFSIGRPLIAQALVDAGHAPDHNAAFDTLIGEGCEAYVPRTGAPPEEVAAIVRQAGGLVSLAHPVLLPDQSLVPGIAALLDAIEVRHSEHGEEDEARYRALAADLGLAVTGGSDFHGETRGTRALLGFVTLPEDDFAAFAARRP